MTDPTPSDVVLTSEQIAGLLPHRYPFALVDRVIAYEPGVSATAIKNITMNEPQFQGHFPERPLMPGVLIVEAMAQVGGLIVAQIPDLPKGLFVFAGIDGVRFRRPVVPGDQLIIQCELLKRDLRKDAFTKKGKKATFKTEPLQFKTDEQDDRTNEVFAIIGWDIVCDVTPRA